MQERSPRTGGAGDPLSPCVSIWLVYCSQLRRFTGCHHPLSCCKPILPSLDRHLVSLCVSFVETPSGLIPPIRRYMPAALECITQTLLSQVLGTGRKRVWEH